MYKVASQSAQSRVLRGVLFGTQSEEKPTQEHDVRGALMAEKKAVIERKARIEAELSEMKRRRVRDLAAHSLLVAEKHRLDSRLTDLNAQIRELNIENNEKDHSQFFRSFHKQARLVLSSDQYEQIASVAEQKSGSCRP